MIIVFSQEITNRLQYIFRYIFEEILKISVHFTSDIQAFNKSDYFKINYSSVPASCQLKMHPHSLLFQQGISYQNLDPVISEDEVFFFESSADSFLPFDPFAASFYLISRYEEYHIRELDEHCRYPSHHSILYRNHLLHKPVVNQWAQLIAKKIEASHPEFHIQNAQFSFLSTIDIDNAWAYKNKSLVRTGGALLKGFLKGDVKINTERIQVLLNKKDDPYDTYAFIEKLYENRRELLHFFILLGKTSKYDRNISSQNKEMQKLVEELCSRYAVGIHPSYRSTKNQNGLAVPALNPT